MWSAGIYSIPLPSSTTVRTTGFVHLGYHLPLFYLLKSYLLFNVQPKCHLFHEAYSDFPSQSDLVLWPSLAIHLSLLHFILTTWGYMHFHDEIISSKRTSPQFLGLLSVHSYPQVNGKQAIDICWIVFLKTHLDRFI